MVMRTVVLPIQLVPDPPAEHEWTPDERLVIARFPAVPPDATVVCPDKRGIAAIPLEGVIADGVTSPIVTVSVSENEDPEVVTALSV